MSEEELTPLQEAILRFVKEHGHSTKEDIEAGVLLALHGMEYRGGGWEAAMEAIRERIALMDLLRIQGTLGQGCIEDGVRSHLPELCLTEGRQFRAWERSSQGKGTSAEEAYHVAKRVAQWNWFKQYGEHWNTGPIMQLRVDAWMLWTSELYG